MIDSVNTNEIPKKIAPLKNKVVFKGGSHGQKSKSELLVTKDLPNYLQPFVHGDLQHVTLHGGWDPEGQNLVVGMYGNHFQDSNSENNRENFQNPSSLLTMASSKSLWKGLGIHNPKFREYVTSLPALGYQIPMPGPRALNVFLSDINDLERPTRIKRKKRLIKCVGTHKWRSFLFHGCAIFDADLPNVSENLLALEKLIPGTLTPTFLKSLKLRVDFLDELAQCWRSGQWIPLSDEEALCAKGQLENKWLTLPNWSKYSASLAEAEPTLKTITELWPNMSFTRAQWWVQRFHQAFLFGIAVPNNSADRKKRIGLLDKNFDFSEASIRMVCHLSHTFVQSRKLDINALSTNKKIETLAAGLKLRAQHNSIVSLLTMSQPMRPSEPKGAFLATAENPQILPNPNSTPLTTETTPTPLVMVVEPAVVSPNVLSMKANEINKARIGLAEQHITLGNLLETKNDSPPSLFVGNGVPYPGQRHVALAEIIRLAIAFPHWFGTTDFVKSLRLELTPEQYALFQNDYASRIDNEEKTRGGSTQILKTLCPWKTLVNRTQNSPPWHTRVLVPHTETKAKGLKWFLSKFESEALRVEIKLHNVHRPVQVNLQVHYEPHMEGTWSQTIQDVIDCINQGKIKNTAPNENSEHTEGNTLLSEQDFHDFSKLYEDLTFKPVPLFQVDGQTVSVEDWTSAKKSGPGFYQLPSGKLIPTEVYEATTKSFVIRQKVLAKLGPLKLNNLWQYHMALNPPTHEGFSPVNYLKSLDFTLSPLINQLQNSLESTLEQALPKRLPPHLYETLRPYQKKGVAWLWSRTQCGLGACLADDMGLGKTIQTLCFLHLHKKSDSPSLVIAPKSVVGNWLREFEKFLPGFQVSEVVDESGLNQNRDVYIMSYPRMRILSEVLSETQWNVLVLDEAHTIKNVETQLSAAARKLSAEHRVALTGTPVENKAAELWSLVDWLNPGFLGQQNQFVSFTSIARNSQEKQLMLKPIRSMLNPILLRRVKSDPAIGLDLPSKIIENLNYDLSEEQQILYKSVLEIIILGVEEAKTIFVKQALYLKALLHLKQICNHPENFLGNQQSDWFEDLDKQLDISDEVQSKLKKLIAQKEKEISKHWSQMGELDALLVRSGKLQIFRDLALNCRGQSSGLLVFTQYHATARLLQRALSLMGPEEWQNIQFLHGGLTLEARMEIVDHFQQQCKTEKKQRLGNLPILIASLKAGGVGLNLMEADTVVHYDRWWNPAVEDQATDRIYRIGQQNSVSVYTLTGENTLEQSIAKLMDQKRLLAADLLGIAAGEQVSDILKNSNGFLEFVDPNRTFIK